jgi:hypothetical protein
VCRSGEGGLEASASERADRDGQAVGGDWPCVSGQWGGGDWTLLQSRCVFA